jgi:SAM-dependent methyltransferase
MFRSKSLLFVLALLSGLLIAPLHQASGQESKAPLGQAQAQPSDEVVWQRFLEWLRAAPQADSPSAFFLQYQSRLKSTGTSVAEINREAAIIRRMMEERSDGWRIMFDNIYRTSTPGFVTQPNALLVSTVEGRKPGRALDIGMGQGRNSVFLALKGWDVTGFDVSDEGLAVARKNAERAGVKLNAIRESDEAFDYGSDQWDLIVFEYNPLPVTSTAYVERLRKSLKAGGLIVIESHATDPRLPVQMPTAIEPGRLLAAFKDFRLLLFEDTTGIPDWMADTTNRIVRMVVERRP